MYAFKSSDPAKILFKYDNVFNLAKGSVVLMSWVASTSQSWFKEDTISNSYNFIALLDDQKCFIVVYENALKVNKNKAISIVVCDLGKELVRLATVVDLEGQYKKLITLEIENTVTKMTRLQLITYRSRLDENTKSDGNLEIVAEIDLGEKKLVGLISITHKSLVEPGNFFIINHYQQDIYGFLVKNLDLDSNLYNLEKRIKKAS
jgi:hypothetical protein